MGRAHPSRRTNGNYFAQNRLSGYKLRNEEPFLCKVLLIRCGPRLIAFAP
jgi:hypothetical protein